MPLSAVEKPLDDIPLSELKAAMAFGKRKIQMKLRKAIASGSDSVKYYEERYAEISKIYDDLNEIMKLYLGKQVPKQFAKATRIANDFLAKYGLRRGAQITPLAALQAIIQNTMLYMESASDGGKANVRQLFRLTQQQVVAEKQINRAIAEGVISENTVVSAAKSLQKKLESQLIDRGRVLTTNRVTGKQRSFTPEYYAELTARTRTRESQSLGVINTTLEYGQDLVKVSSHNTKSPQCKDHEGKIYSITGRTPGYEKYEGENRVPFHPNCWHVISPHISREGLGMFRA